MDAITADELHARIETARRERIQLDAGELAKMAQVMRDEDGLLNLPQAATCLGVTPRRVQQLALDGTLQRWTFMGQHYVSFRQVTARRLADVKAGRPKRGILTRVSLGVKAATQHDRAQLALGGFQGQRK